MKLLKINEVIEKTKLSKSSIFAFVKNGTFPKPIKLGARSIAWIDGELDEWILNLKRKENK